MPIPLFKFSDKDITLFVGVFFVALGFETIKFCGVVRTTLRYAQIMWLCKCVERQSLRHPIGASSLHADPYCSKGGFGASRTSPPTEECGWVRILGVLVWVEASRRHLIHRKCGPPSPTGEGEWGVLFV